MKVNGVAMVIQIKDKLSNKGTAKHTADLFSLMLMLMDTISDRTVSGWDTNAKRCLDDIILLTSQSDVLPDVEWFNSLAGEIRRNVYVRYQWCAGLAAYFDWLSQIILLEIMWRGRPRLRESHRQVVNELKSCEIFDSREEV